MFAPFLKALRKLTSQEAKSIAGFMKLEIEKIHKTGKNSVMSSNQPKKLKECFPILFKEY